MAESGLGFDEGVRWLVSLGGSGGVFLFRSINNCFIYRVIFVITNIVIIHKVLNNYCFNYLSVSHPLTRGEYFYFCCRKPPRNENGLAADFGRKMAELHVIFRYFPLFDRF